ncbi:MAG: 5'-3' exonuclease H3TH domain-containing protein [Pseudomonadota bacterium]|nr:5'-3' exonuclease H3TH domain-containing protein [Pseudomonadota bacterium]
MTPRARRRVVIVDASIWIFRAHFSLPAAIRDDLNRPAAALQGWASVLLGELARRPAAIGVAFDEALFTGFRHRLYPAYKADRALPDEDLAGQLLRARAFAEALGLCTAASEEFEADDLIATAAARARAADHAVEIVSRDKDLLQSVRAPDDVMREIDPTRFVDLAAAEARFGVATGLIPDVQALSGDAIDGIPGIRGIGARTASQVIARYGPLESLYEALEQDETALDGLRGAARVRQRLLEARREAFLFRELTRARDDADVPFAPHAAPVPSPRREDVRQALAAVGLDGRLNTRVRAFPEAA